MRSLRQIIFEDTEAIAASISAAKTQAGKQDGEAEEAKEGAGSGSSSSSSSRSKAQQQRLDVVHMVRQGELRPSTLWHHLISRAPTELPSPHEMRGWTISRYVTWLDVGGDRGKDGAGGAGGAGGRGAAAAGGGGGGAGAGGRLLSSAPAGIDDLGRGANMGGASSLNGGDDSGSSSSSGGGGGTIERFMDSDPLDEREVGGGGGGGGGVAGGDGRGVPRRVWQTVLHAEQSAWAHVRRCLEAYVQRTSVLKRRSQFSETGAGPTTGAAAGLAPVYQVLLESGPVLLAAFGEFVQEQQQ